MYQINTAAPIYFVLISTSDGSAVTGATVSVAVTIDDAGQGAGGGTVDELGSGQYRYNATADDMDCSQAIGFLFTATGAVSVSVTIAPDSKLVSQLNDIAAGTQMDLVASPNATAITAIQSGLATSVNITSLQTHGDSNWATATGFALAGSVPSWYTAPDNSDIASLITSVGSSLGTHVSSILTIVGTSGVVVGTSSVTAIQSGLATSTNISDLQTHGDSNWSTATGFALASIWTSDLATTISTNLDTNVGSRAAPDDAMTLAASEDIYPATISLTIDNADSQDEYTVCWFWNGTPVTSGITNPLIQVVDRATGSNLIASTSLVQVGSTGIYKHDEPTNRITDGDAYIVQVSATINGNTRTWQQIVSRDG